MFERPKLGITCPDWSQSKLKLSFIAITNRLCDLYDLNDELWVRRRGRGRESCRDHSEWFGIVGVSEALVCMVCHSVLLAVMYESDCIGIRIIANPELRFRYSDEWCVCQWLCAGVPIADRLLRTTEALVMALVLCNCDWRSWERLDICELLYTYWTNLTNLLIGVESGWVWLRLIDVSVVSGI